MEFSKVFQGFPFLDIFFVHFSKIKNTFETKNQGFFKRKERKNK
jgi:hypothetical protein